MDKVQLPPQLFAGLAPSEDEIRPIENVPYHVKPKGGLWTSTWDDERGSGWVQWCLSEEFSGPEFPCYLLQPRAAKLAIVRCETDLAKLGLCYEWIPEKDIGVSIRRLDYEAMARDGWDGVHLTEEGQWLTRFSHPWDLYGWDCESTLWFRWCFGPVENLGTRTFPEVRALA